VIASRLVTNAWPPVGVRGTRDVGRALSLEEWLALDEDEAGEWVEGRLVDEEASDYTHELTISWLIRVVAFWLGGRGYLVGSETRVLTTPLTGRRPDLSLILPGSPPPPATGPLRTAPDVVIEVVTPTPQDERRDRIEKMGEYARFGVPYYWLVDPALSAFEMYERTPQGHYQRLVGVTGGRIENVPGCAGLVLDVDALWAELLRNDEPTG
jgi:Uma2 family endonuclease